MARQPKTLELFKQMHAVLAEEHPMTVRQVYYQLVGRQLIDNNASQYDRIQRNLVNARYDGAVPWEWVEDRLRKSMGSLHGFADPAAFVESMRVHTGLGYSRDIWASQPRYIEAWVEKDALSSIFEGVLDDYEVGLNVGRGYTSASAARAVAQRFKAQADKHEKGSLILYWGDFDPSGEDMVRDLQDRLELDFAGDVFVFKCGLTLEQVQRYQLPHDFTKAKDSRAAAHIAKYGDVAVELDALRPDVLRQNIKETVEGLMDMDALRRVRDLEAREGKAIRAEVVRLFEGFTLPDDLAAAQPPQPEPAEPTEPTDTDETVQAYRAARDDMKRAVHAAFVAYIEADMDAGENARLRATWSHLHDVLYGNDDTEADDDGDE